MKKSRLICCLCLFGCIVLLTGCTKKSIVPPVKVYSSFHSAPTLRDQCKRLHDEQLFVRAHRHDMAEWEYLKKSKELHDKYQKLGCYRVRHHVHPHR